jgi:hypothetical protein
LRLVTNIFKSKNLYKNWKSNQLNIPDSWPFANVGDCIAASLVAGDEAFAAFIHVRPC